MQPFSNILDIKLHRGEQKYKYFIFTMMLKFIRLRFKIVIPFRLYRLTLVHKYRLQVTKLVLYSIYNIQKPFYIKFHPN